MENIDLDLTNADLLTLCNKSYIFHNYHNISGTSNLHESFCAERNGNIKHPSHEPEDLKRPGEAIPRLPIFPLKPSYHHLLTRSIPLFSSFHHLNSSNYNETIGIKSETIRTETQDLKEMDSQLRNISVKPVPRRQQSLQSDHHYSTRHTLGSLLSRSRTSDKCRDGVVHWTFLDGVCYTVSESPAMWHNAQYACEGAKAHLATITDAKQADTLQRLIRTR